MSWQRVRTEFESLCELPDGAVAARIAELETMDAELAAQVRRLLASDRAAASFLVRGAPVPGAAATAGTRLGRYELVRPLGSGGMGSVWEARQTEPERRVALKLVAWRGRDDEARWRFRHEAQALAQLGHPAIAALYEVGESDVGGTSVAWLAMELVDYALDVVAWADRERLPRRDRLALLVQLGEAVEHGHRAGVLHRDLKPANVLVSRDGRLKLIDFGIARALGEEADAVHRTAPGAIVGTLAYMAPEQLRGDRGANGVASDVWSLGVLAYRLLCGRMPFLVDGLPFAAVVRRVLEQDPEPPRGVQPDLPDELAWILERALAKEPARRYATVRDLLDDLRRHELHEPVLAKPAGAAYRVRKFVRRHRLALAVAGLLAAGLGTGAGFLLHGRREAEAGARNARRGADLARELARVTIGMFDAVDDTAASKDVRVHELLDRGQFAPGSLREPAVEFAVREVRGRVYARMRRFAEARFEFDQAATLLGGRLDVLDEVAAMEREAIFRARHGRLLAATGERERGEAMVRAAEAATAGARPTVRIDVAVEACHLLVDAGRHEDLLRSAAELRDLARAEGQPTVVARAEAMMADAASALGRHEEAVELSRGAWTTLRALRSEADSATVAAFANHVRALQEAGNLDEVETLYPDLVAATAAAYGPTHEHSLIVAGNQATLLLSRGKLKQALAALREVVQRYEARGGAPTSDHLAMVNNLGMVLYQGAKFDAAEPHLRRAAEFTGKLLDPRDPDGVSIRFNHAACLGAMKRWDAAKPVLLAEYAAAQAILPAGHTTLGKMRRTLSQLCAINGEPDAAEAFGPR